MDANTQFDTPLGGDSLQSIAHLPLLLTVEAAGVQLSLGRTEAFALVKSGELESVVIGQRARRVPRQALLDYVTRLRAQNQRAN
ncbi:helix-turn-helix domain-containing protein [Nonomuraea sp. CA-143628]|uniref:helix-turn-helix domain-containing protein n=1 Tax=Nonomuraea sp. CA-143628 TaxID=3239997 RepID=UPI003D8D0287